MSLTTTIAYDSVPQTRNFSFKGIGMVIAALIFGAVIGSVIMSNSTTTEVAKTAATGMPLDDFIRLNTTSFNGLAPVAAVQPLAAGDPFLEMNVSSYDGLVPTLSPDTAARGNVVSPQFVYWNTVSFDSLVPGATSSPVSPTVDARFYELNTTSLEYPGGKYSLRPFGPR